MGVEQSTEGLLTKARGNPNLIDLVEALLQSPMVGPLPRYGTYKGNFEAEIPHILRSSTTEHVDIVKEPTKTGDRVLVWTAVEWPEYEPPFDM
ncbi:hypothetical protein A2630_01275 [Candidatus Woesebacteria bacterium RIFCSPHIGHO2_01_FULL_44_10]|uniref:Uncharacterized protein n=1 Tax=Candidatus Woesebacteria bacterium RIFCSPLOWO2_01_FULL_44_14 TaxID=1802525 RepID=A0A1F8C369_9BACT|nr:MAG: hypothetical protein A2630_01275 [Candidatus Woesebacteria bacterium RIFCSPHIGHO2_01_FULL_44_10]OGM55672.1 MAG: hypothetical protein A3F62_02515 [Candidatus Woesebacteria bacterium RIFCSPHIGHO2_12_FULL_44_11]OGM70098.1 MAG: hypothetical protein A2975_03415 [Candidatus Woesebacteria bacterium RIFCSPLOWO2_01_FULL_44_14]